MDMGEIIYNTVVLIGTAAFAVSGAMSAVSRKLDMFGVVFVGAVTALGGGVVRDVLLGNLPPVMFRNYSYLITAVFFSLAVFFSAYFFKEKYSASAAAIDKINNVFDAAGLGPFTVMGVDAAIASGFGSNCFFCIFLGMTTGIGGGIFRDMLTASTPSVLKKHVYAVASIAGACLYYFLYVFSFSSALSLIFSSLLVFLIRILATHYKWNFPTA